MLIGKHYNHSGFSPAPKLPENGHLAKNTNLVRGFTIIETLIVFVILTVGVIYIVSVFPMGLKATGQSIKASVGTNLAQAKIESIISQQYEDVPIGQTTEASLAAIDTDFSAYARITTVAYVDGNLNNSAIDLGLKKIIVKVIWPNSGTTASTSVVTIINNF